MRPDAQYVQQTCPPQEERRLPEISNNHIYSIQLHCSVREKVPKKLPGQSTLPPVLPQTTHQNLSVRPATACGPGRPTSEMRQKRRRSSEPPMEARICTDGRSQLICSDTKWSHIHPSNRALEKDLRSHPDANPLPPFTDRAAHSPGGERLDVKMQHHVRWSSESV